jgi:two-component system sensor histidine kinase DesK
MPPTLPCDKPKTPAIQPMRMRESLLSRYIWLLYSLFFFVQPIMEKKLHEWELFIPFYILFLFFYIYPDVNRRAGIWCVLGMFLLGLAYVPLNPGVAGIFIFVSAFLPFVITSLPLALTALAAVAAIECLHGWYFHLHSYIWGPIAVIATVVGAANLAHAREKRSNAKLLRAQEEIEHLATVAERERIARDLHDVLGHTLSMITLKAELAGKLLTTDPARAAAEIADVEQTARRALAEVREAVGGYRAQGLKAELARARQTLFSANVELDAGEPPRNIPPGEETVLALIVREAVTNIVRHAQATECRVRFVTAKDQILLIIKDNGRGTVTKEGNGLRGMRERAEALGGELSWQSGSSLSRGLELRIQIPVRTQLPLSEPAPKVETPPERQLTDLPLSVRQLPDREPAA